MDESGVWTVFPAYDLTYSSAPNGEHSTMVMSEGKNPTLQHFLRLAAIADIKGSRALQIVDEVVASISKWKQHANLVGVSQRSRKRIQTALDHTTRLFTNR